LPASSKALPVSTSVPPAEKRVPAPGLVIVTCGGAPTATNAGEVTIASLNPSET
jgi:hypothetical protein